MKTLLGEEGTEQFEISTRVNGLLIRKQAIHDPFIHSTTTLRGWRHAWRALTKGITVNIHVGGSFGAERAIMSLSPDDLQVETAAHLKYCAESRARMAMAGTNSAACSIN